MTKLTVEGKRVKGGRREREGTGGVEGSVSTKEKIKQRYRERLEKEIEIVREREKEKRLMFSASSVVCVRRFYI